MATLTGSAGDDFLTGSRANDVFHLEDGGYDTVLGGHGYDIFYLGATLGEGDRINGGVGGDGVKLDGDYSGGLLLSDALLVGIEGIGVTHGHDYDMTLANSLIETTEAGVFTVTGSDLRPGDHLRVDASAVDHGRVYIFGGAGDDLLIASPTGTGFDLGAGGSDTVAGGAGDDFFGCGRQFSAGLHVDGGGGFDEMSFKGGSAPIVLDGVAIRSIETVNVLADSITLVTADAFLKPGRHLLVEAAYKADGFSFDGSAEADGWFKLHGGNRADHLIGGGMGDEILGGLYGDTIQGGGGRDTLAGGDGHDVFVYLSIGDSRPEAADTLVDLDEADIIDLSAIDADTTQAGDQKFHLVGAFTHRAGQLVMVVGDGVTQLLADINGDGVADMEVDLTGDHGDFTHFKF